MRVTTVRALPSGHRRLLESAVVDGRQAAEAASRASLRALGVEDDRVPGHLSEDQRALRRGLRAKLRQLGGEFDLLVAECAYEQWHRLLFARYLAENELLLHPEYRAPVTIAECEELAPDLGEPDGWAVAARFAAEILPGIFRLEDPCVQLRLAPEGRLALERVMSDLPTQVFKADDSLGWVYQFWQKEKKDDVNASERRIGGADLGPVTQLFTENYMVRFLLENSLGAWWAARYPASPLVKDFDYLRFGEDGRPAAGSFDGWPDRVAEVTVMDPCCGSGHFLVEAFSMLWRMRAEEEGLSPVAAQDAVLRDNLFGLELDPRCVEIAMMAVALQAWKVGGGWRELPVPSIACSGIPVKAPVDEWKALADGDQRLEKALVRLHILFRDADTLGSLIDPKRATEITDPTGLQQSFEDVDWDEVAPLLEKAALRETGDPATAVLGADAAGIARAADYLSRQYTLVTTNPPWLGMQRQEGKLADFIENVFPVGKYELATAFAERWENCSSAVALVLPQTWMFIAGYRGFRKKLLSEHRLASIARLGAGAFSSISGEVVQPVLTTLEIGVGANSHPVAFLNATDAVGVEKKACHLRSGLLKAIDQNRFARVPDQRIVPDLPLHLPFLEEFADAYWGIGTGDGERFQRFWWEVDDLDYAWAYLHRTFGTTGPFEGRTGAIWWCKGEGPIQRESALLRNRPTRGDSAWGCAGIAVNQTGNLEASLYLGDIFQAGVAAVIPKRSEDVGAVWAFVSSGGYRELVRLIDPKLGVMNRTLLRVPFDVEYWRRVAEERFPDGLPKPWSDDPTQWLFEGRPEVSTDPLQVTVARLVGHRWPEQVESDDLDRFVDSDGIVCLPSVAGEAPAADRVQRVLSAAFGDEWSPSMVKRLLEESGSKKGNLVDWLRDDFFKRHCGTFGNRPFIWHIWDGRKDGFSALVNYHRLDRKTLEKLTYTYLGQDWVERQKAERRDDVPGAEARLAAALDLQRRLEAILEGEPPFDIYVRWKSLDEQSIGWDPDLNDGVRLNSRPFIKAGVLRSKFNVHWRKDRGKNPDGSERHNDLHFTRAEKLDARREAGRL